MEYRNASRGAHSAYMIKLNTCYNLTQRDMQQRQEKKRKKIQAKFKYKHIDSRKKEEETYSNRAKVKRNTIHSYNEHQNESLTHSN